MGGGLRDGERYAGRYTIQKRLGAGGMGVVYAARDERLGREVAIKVLAPAAVGDADAQARLMREARAAALVESASIVRVYDVAQDGDGGLYMVMERIRGESVGALVARGELSVGRAVEILAELARALGVAHRAGLVHRDVKPENAMVREDGSVVLLDLGLARSTTPVAGDADAAKLTAEGTIVGTPAYLAPEQAHGKDVGPAADQFSLAVMAFEMLAGRLPWTAPTPTAHLVAMLTESPAVASRLNAALPPAVDGVFERALSRTATDRYASIEQFPAALAEALGAAALVRAPSGTLASDPTMAAPVPSRPPTSAAATPPAPSTAAVPAPTRRTRWPVTAAFVVVAALGVGGWQWAAHHGDAAAAPNAAALLASPSSVVACPMLEAQGGEAPNAWLGAAAASAACTRLQWTLGGRAERTLAPAELLDLPRRVVDDFPDAPYDAPDARARTVAAARSRAAAYVDGRVVQRDDDFTVELVLRRPDGSEAARVGPVTDTILRFAVSHAVEQLVATAHLPAARALDPEVALWTGMRTPEEALTVDTDRALLRLDDVSVCGWLREHPNGFGTDVLDRGQRCFLRGAPPLDRTTPAALARTAYRRALLPDPEDLSPIARELGTALERETSPLGRATIAHAASVLAMKADDFEHGRALLLLATREAPRNPLAWDDLLDATNGTTGAESDVRAMAAWFPDEEYPWWRLGRDPATTDPELTLRYVRRGYTIYPGETPSSVLAANLASAQRWAELRSLGADQTTRQYGSRGNGEFMLATVDMGQARFAASFRRVRAALGAALLDHTLRERESDLSLIRLGVELAEVLGARQELADELVHRVFDPEPPRLSPTNWYEEGLVASVCMLASPPEARRCFDALRALDARHFFLVQSPSDRAMIAMADAYARGDYAAAATAAHQVASIGIRGALTQVTAVLDAAGLADDADRLDLAAVATPGPLNLPLLSALRSARRAEARGDHPAAVRLAQTVVDGWGDADTPLAAVAEMRALIARR